MVSFLVIILTKTTEQVQSSVLPSFHHPPWNMGQCISSFRSMGSRAAGIASPGNFSKIQLSWAHPKSTESESWQVDPEICILTSLLGDSAAQI